MKIDGYNIIAVLPVFAGYETPTLYNIVGVSLDGGTAVTATVGSLEDRTLVGGTYFYTDECVRYAVTLAYLLTFDNTPVDLVAHLLGTSSARP